MVKVKRSNEELLRNHSIGKKASLKGPRDLNSMYDEKPEPKWPKGMRPFIDYPVLNVPQEYPIEEFRKSQVITDHPQEANTTKTDFIEEYVYQCVYDTKSMEPYYRLKGPDDDTLIFESRFESGNLSMATKT